MNLRRESISAASSYERAQSRWSAAAAIGKENNKGFALIGALNADQRRQAILNYRVEPSCARSRGGWQDDTTRRHSRDGAHRQPAGNASGSRTRMGRHSQRRRCRSWDGGDPIESVAHLLRLEWRNRNGGIAYFRIQGPTVVIEHAPQQGDLDHIHTIYRDPTNDYGARLITL